MKKTIAKIILALMLLALTLSLFCACGKNVEVSKVNIIKANSTKTLLEKYGSFEFRLNSAQEECGYYIDNDMAYYCQGDYHEITSDGLQYGEDSNGSFVNFYAGVKMDLSYFECLAFAVETFAAEEIVSSKQNGDTITLKTKLTVAKLVLLGYNYSDEIAKDGYFTMEYVLDAETLELKTCKETLTWDGGNRKEERNMSFEYGVSRPEKAEELAAARSTGEKISLSAVVFPGTSNEKTYTMQCNKGDYAWFVIDEGLSVYTNEECTKMFTAYNKMSEDTTYYISK